MNLTAIDSLKFEEAALSTIEWKMAMDEDMDALENKKTWESVGLPKGKKVVGCDKIVSFTLLPLRINGRTPIITYYCRKHRRLNKEEANGSTGRVYRGHLSGKGGKDNGL